jgi:hypothetical protein
MSKGKRIDWSALDPTLRALAAEGQNLAAIARRMSIDSGAVSAHARQIGVVIRKGEGNRFTALAPRSMAGGHEPSARQIPALSELVPLRSLGQC